LRGRTVQSVIDELRASGAPLVYSSNLLPATLTVAAEPAGTTPLAVAREILQPHGLGVREEGGVWLVVRVESPPTLPATLVVLVQSAYSGAPVAAATVQADAPAGPIVAADGGRAELADLTPGRHTVIVRAAGFLPERVSVNAEAGVTAEIVVGLFEAVARLEEITVTASRYDVTNAAQPSATHFSRDEIETLASLGDDTVRVAQRLPGVASNELSARPHVRGGNTNEFAVLLDGVRLVEPYHLRDFQGVFSGLMVIEPREPTELAHELGFSVLYTSLLTSGTFADGGASWLVSARNSNLDRVLADELGQPAYADVFARVGADLGAKHRLTIGGLHFRDDILLTPDDAVDDLEQATSDTDSRQQWLKLDSEWSDELTSTMWWYSTDFTSWRRESVVDLAEIIGAVDDRRELEAVGVKQAWGYTLSDRQHLRFGMEAEQRDAVYSYASTVARFGLLATLGGTAPPLRVAALAPSGRSYGAYVTDRVRVTERLIAELGVRWDRQDYLPPGADSQFSPRASVLYRLGESTDLRVSHGRFFQPESMLDLEVGDGVGEFSRAQNAAHSIVSIERRLTGTLALRAEMYRKRTRHVRPHHENLFDPFVLVPELRANRVRIAPERAEARGFELLVSGEQPVSWWVGASFARVEDEIAGVGVPRSWDQQRALNAGVTWPIAGWTLSAAASLNRGWPATEITVVTLPSGARAAQAGVRNAVRLSTVRRLDFRASRDVALRGSALRMFAEITNLTNRDNACCLVYEPVTLASGLPSLAGSERGRAGVTGNLGVLWQF
jgi:hypothetical protein